MKVRAILKDKGIVRADPDETLVSVLSRLSSQHDAAFLFDDNDTFCGVINPYYATIRRSYPARTKAGNCRMNPPKVQVADSIERVAKLMIESKIHYLPVFEGKAFKGIVTARRILSALKNEGKLKIRSGKMIAEKKPLITVFADDSIAQAVELFKTHKVSKLVAVTPEFTLKGILVYYDLVPLMTIPRQRIPFVTSVDKNPALKRKVKNYYKTKVLTVSSQDMLERVVDLIIAEEIGTVVVIDGKRHPLGIITTQDLLSTVTEDKKRSFVEFVPINLSPPNLKAAEYFVQSIADKFTRKKTPERAVIKVSEKKGGGIFEVALHVFTEGKPVKVITKQGKNLFVVLMKFQETITSYFTKRNTPKRK